VRYHQLTSEERYALSALRRQGLSQAAIGRALGRHPSTIGREVKRNSRKDGGYRPFSAGEMARGRLSRSRRPTGGSTSRTGHWSARAWRCTGARSRLPAGCTGTSC
jgi:IS30 family transposase